MRANDIASTPSGVPSSSRASLRIRGPAGIAVEPPVELGRRHRRAVRLLHQREKLVAPRWLDDHFDDVPSAALKTRRARVPVTVSFTAIRSHAPASTSSNVRGEYGSTL